SLVTQRRQQPLKHLDLRAVEPPDPFGTGALLGLGEALLSRAELVTQLGVLLGQPPLPGLDAGQLLLQAGHRPGKPRLAATGSWLRSEPLHDLQQEPPRQFVVVEVLGASR